MSAYKWKQGDKCLDGYGNQCVILGYSPDGDLCWHFYCHPTWRFMSECGSTPDAYPVPPVRTLARRVVMSGGHLEFANVMNMPNNVEFDLRNGELVAVRMIGASEL